MDWARTLTRWVLVLAVALLPGAASAGFIFGGLQPPPDIASNNVQVDYDAGTDDFTASGVAAEVNDGGGTSLIFGGTFDVSATIDAAGNVSAGSLSINGNVPNLAVNGLLISASVVDVGFPDSPGEPLQFLVNNISGLLAFLYPSEAGVVITGTGFTGWGGNFSNNGLGTADTAPIPEPGTAMLLGLGLAALGAARSRRGAVLA